MKLCNHVCACECALPSMYLHRFRECACVFVLFRKRRKTFFDTIFLFPPSSKWWIHTNERKWKAAAVKLNSLSRIIYTSAHTHIHTLAHVLHTQSRTHTPKHFSFYYVHNVERSRSLFLSLMFASYVYARKHKHTYTHKPRFVYVFKHKYTRVASWYVCTHTHTHTHSFHSVSLSFIQNIKYSSTSIGKTYTCIKGKNFKRFENSAEKKYTTEFFSYEKKVREIHASSS